MRSICNFGYARSKRGGGSFPDVRGLLKYLQYRDNRDDHIPMAGGPDRWVDGGLGTCYQHILARLDELSPANRHAYCHVVMVSPDPEALSQVRGDLGQARFVETVRAALEEWEAWRLEHDEKPQVGPLEYSFVVHRPVREYGEQMHAHVILAAATENALTRERTPLYNNRPEIGAFKEIVYRELDRAYDLERERDELDRAYDLKRERDEPELAFEREVEAEVGFGFDLEMSL
jgi:hypothetical protein